MPSTDVPVLLVEPDLLLSEMLQAALRLHRTGLDPMIARSPREALELAGQHEFQLVLSEVALPTPGDGQRLVRGLNELLPMTPILVLFDGPATALASLLDLDVTVVTKPPDMDHLLWRVDQLLERSGGSLVRGISLEGLLQMLEAERKTCRVVVSARGDEGRLWLVGGRLVHAETASASGVEALFETLSWATPVLRIVSGRATERTVEADLQSLLLQFCVEADHRRRDGDGGLE